MKKNVLVLGLLSVAASAQAEVVREPQSELMTSSCLRTQAGSPLVDFTDIEGCEEDCDQIVAFYPASTYRGCDEDGEPAFAGHSMAAKRFSEDAELRAAARYRDVSYALVEDREKDADGDKHTVRYIVSSRRSYKKISLKQCKYAMETSILPDGRLICLQPDKLVVGEGRNQKAYPLPSETKAITGTLNNNVAGTMAIAYISDEDYELHTTNHFRLDENSDQGWQSAETTFHDRADFFDVMTVYPVNKYKTVVGTYEYINTYNKGLNLYYFDRSGLVSNGQMVNKKDENIGFSPDLFVNGQGVYLTSNNSSLHQDQTYYMPANELNELKMQEMDFKYPSIMDLLAGYGLQYTTWDINQKIKSGDTKHAKTDYQMNDNFLHSYYMQGRIGNTQLAVEYLTSEAKESDNNLVAESADNLNMLIDFNDFFSGADTLRLKFNKLDTGGIATYSDIDDNKFQTEFETQMTNMQALIMTERGLYFGLGYSDYKMPSAVGFADTSGSLEGVSFDQDFGIERYMLVVGYDEASYGVRYETSYNRPYIELELGLGINKLDVSKQALIDAVGTDEGDIKGEYTFALAGEIELGWTYQRRIESLRGLGLSVQAGYRAKAELTSQSWEDSNDLPDDGWLLVYDRTDIWHGPFVQVNAIF